MNENDYAGICAENLVQEIIKRDSEIARMRPVFRAGMALFQNNRHGLNLPANGSDCEGEYWILRAEWKDVATFRSTCAKYERKVKGE